jgi:hypothetical protein
MKEKRQKRFAKHENEQKQKEVGRMGHLDMFPWTKV